MFVTHVCGNDCTDASGYETGEVYERPRRWAPGGRLWAPRPRLLTDTVPGAGAASRLLHLCQTTRGRDPERSRPNDLSHLRTSDYYIFGISDVTFLQIRIRSYCCFYHNSCA